LYTGRRLVAERSDAEQRGRNLLHPDRRTRALDGRLLARVHLQVQAAGRPQEGLCVDIDADSISTAARSTPADPGK